MLVRFCFWLLWSHPKRKLVFQPFTFRCYVSFREGTSSIRWTTISLRKTRQFWPKMNSCPLYHPCPKVSKEHFITLLASKVPFKIRMLCACVLSFDKLEYSKWITYVRFFPHNFVAWKSLKPSMLGVHLSQLPPPVIVVLIIQATPVCLAGWWVPVSRVMTPPPPKKGLIRGEKDG